MKKGEIYKLSPDFRGDYSADCYNHPFVFWEQENADFNGIMLTTSDNPNFKNILMKKEHIEEGYEFKFGKSPKRPNSYIAPLYLLKDVKYEHLIKVGQLTEEGLYFISDRLHLLEHTDWIYYMKRK